MGAEQKQADKPLLLMGPCRPPVETVSEARPAMKSEEGGRREG